LDSADLNAVLDDFLAIELSVKDGRSVPSVRRLKVTVLEHSDDEIEDVLVNESEDGFDSGDEDYMPDYLKKKERPQWDCESIVSTYSNLDNHPARVDDNSKVPKRRFHVDSPARIHLSNKTGLPLNVLCKEKFDSNSTLEIKVNKGDARSRNETKEERASRKQATKEEKNRTRSLKCTESSEKKKLALKSREVRNCFESGVSVFRYV
jgi:protein LTV1